jgi:hypothetical protein
MLLMLSANYLTLFTTCYYKLTILSFNVFTSLLQVTYLLDNYSEIISHLLFNVFFIWISYYDLISLILS